jgi:chromosome segregation ATPase
MDSGQSLPAPGTKINTDEYIKPAAEEFMAALIENLHSALDLAFEQHKDKVSTQLYLADEEAQRAENELARMQTELRDISDSRDLSRYVIQRDISNLQQKLRSAKMQRASDETLYEATAERIAKEQAKRKVLAANDTITKELESILAVHEQRLKEAQKLYDTGNASAADIQDVKEKIIRARIELAQRREQIINPAGGTEISSLNDELAGLTTRMAMAEQEMKSLEKQLEEAKDLLKIADKYELLSLKADIAKQNLEEALLCQARLGRHARSIRMPDVTVIGAE